jgi:hypothetical protein
MTDMRPCNDYRNIPFNPSGFADPGFLKDFASFGAFGCSGNRHRKANGNLNERCVQASKALQGKGVMDTNALSNRKVDGLSDGIRIFHFN